MANMARMGPNFQVYLSAAEVIGEVGVLALGHGFGENGNQQFQDAFAPVADSHPTAVGLGMAMMTSEHIQTAVDGLTGAGARTLVVILPRRPSIMAGSCCSGGIFSGQRENAPWMSVPRVKTDAQVILAPTPTTDPLMSVILLDLCTGIQRRAEERSGRDYFSWSGPVRKKTGGNSRFSKNMPYTCVRTASSPRFARSRCRMMHRAPCAATISVRCGIGCRSSPGRRQAGHRPDQSAGQG